MLKVPSVIIRKEWYMKSFLGLNFDPRHQRDDTNYDPFLDEDVAFA